jgi:hypothetical protein
MAMYDFETFNLLETAVRDASDNLFLAVRNEAVGYEKEIEASKRDADKFIGGIGKVLKKAGLRQGGTKSALDVPSKKNGKRFD